MTIDDLKIVWQAKEKVEMTMQEFFYMVGIVSSVLVIVTIIVFSVIALKVYFLFLRLKQTASKAVFSKIILGVVPLLPFILKGIHLWRKEKRQHEHTGTS
jgi:hypothetical protein